MNIELFSPLIEEIKKDISPSSVDESRQIYVLWLYPRLPKCHDKVSIPPPRFLKYFMNLSVEQCCVITLRVQLLLYCHTQCTNCSEPSYSVQKLFCTIIVRVQLVLYHHTQCITCSVPSYSGYDFCCTITLAVWLLLYRHTQRMTSSVPSFSYYDFCCTVTLIAWLLHQTHSMTPVVPSYSYHYLCCAIIFILWLLLYHHTHSTTSNYYYPHYNVMHIKLATSSATLDALHSVYLSLSNTPGTRYKILQLSLFFPRAFIKPVRAVLS